MPPPTWRPCCRWSSCIGRVSRARGWRQAIREAAPLAAAALTLFWAAFTLAGLRSAHAIHPLAAEPLPGTLLPDLTVVLAARDEAPGVEAAVRSLLAQHYPGRLEIVAVDDRSRDGTGAVLDRLAGADGRLRVVHVTDLPAGWLGKNHALWQGARLAGGEWLLFTDADVRYAPDALARGVQYARRRGLGHLAAGPGMEVRGLLLQAFVGFFVLLLAAVYRPDRAADPRSRAHFGIGAFNLVRADAYVRAGTHAAIRLRPDDDVKLGKILKSSGAASEVASGLGLISVEWYRSLGEAVRGLEKNALTGVEYNFLSAALAPLLVLVVHLGPWLLLPWAAPAVALQAWLYARANRKVTGLPAASFLGYPVGVLAFAWAVWRAAYLAWRRGAVVWRGTAYPLAELRANRC